MVVSDHVPPGLRAFPMHAIRSHRHAGPAIQPRLVRVTMKHNPIHPGGKRPVAQSLQIARMKPPPFIVVGSERFRRDDVPTARVRNGGGLETTEPRVVTVRPKFAHGHVRHRAEIQIRRGIHVVGFDGKSEAVLMGQRLEMFGVVFQHQLLRGLAHIPKETFGDVPARNNASRVCRQESQRIITAPLLKLLTERRRPVLRTHFPTVNVQRNPTDIAAFIRSEFAQQRADKMIKMRVQCGLIEFVGFQSQTGRRSGPGVGAGGGASETQNGPTPRRHGPIQLSVRIQLRREIQNRVRRNGSGVGWRRFASLHGNERFDAGHGGKRIADVKRLLLQVGNARFTFRPGKSEHGDIAIKFTLCFEQLRRQPAGAEVGLTRRRLRQHGVEIGRPDHFHGTGHEELHGLLRFDPRPAAAGPTRSGVQGDLQTQPLRLLNGVFEISSPRVAHEFDRPFRNAHVHFHHDHAAETGALHGFEIGRDALPTRIAIHPHPISPRSRRHRWILKILLQRVRRTCRDNQLGGEQQNNRKQGVGAVRIHKQVL
ncbi:MAG: hypothetical protein BWX84_01674 [Verrucomicrobia bacterium ADurb.Bin118]|nr:MAG: hypothetical protein BWX84_01674 [Verrucomicrobia bacterium ADurb.Bin118]